MKLAVNLIITLVAMNLAGFILASENIISSTFGMTPSQMMFNFTLPDMIIAGAMTVGGILVGLVLHTALGSAILIVWGLGYLTTIGKQFLDGFPMMMESIGVPTSVVWAVRVVMLFALFILILEVTTGRDLT